jgi:hypothetical protein
MRRVEQAEHGNRESFNTDHHEPRNEKLHPCLRTAQLSHKGLSFFFPFSIHNRQRAVAGGYV